MTDEDIYISQKPGLGSLIAFECFEQLGLLLPDIRLFDFAFLPQAGRGLLQPKSIATPEKKPCPTAKMNQIVGLSFSMM